ncbi:hypothetical protein C8R45DRAFT_1069118 [Mycena sanguinolenta]|nr:hypothetical protein C8R45DRAFT_1069118 [Mycena sanguinolenta]
MGLDLDVNPSNSGRLMAPHKKQTLESACSVEDLLTAVRDVVMILQQLFLEHQILHKHIDYNNISIRNSDDGVKGVVIDLDFPDMPERIFGSSRSTNDAGSLCTLAFHSARLLRHRYAEREHEHNLQDDLESVFYVLCWACYGYDHKGRTEKFRPEWMDHWKQRHSDAVHTVYGSKTTFLRSTMESHVNRYMGCQRDILEDIIENLRPTMKSLPDDPEKACASVLDILEKGIEKSVGEKCGTARECESNSSR